LTFSTPSPALTIPSYLRRHVLVVDRSIPPVSSLGVSLFAPAHVRLRRLALRLQDLTHLAPGCSNSRDARRCRARATAAGKGPSRGDPGPTKGRWRRDGGMLLWSCWDRPAGFGPGAGTRVGEAPPILDSLPLILELLLRKVTLHLLAVVVPFAQVVRHNLDPPRLASHAQPSSLRSPVVLHLSLPHSSHGGPSIPFLLAPILFLGPLYSEAYLERLSWRDAWGTLARWTGVRNYVVASLPVAYP
jgi:hypothetical protein